MYELQFTHPITGNYLVHEVRKAVRLKGALEEHFIQLKGDKKYCFKVNPIVSCATCNNIFHCNVSLDVLCCLKHTCIKMFMIALRKGGLYLLCFYITTMRTFLNLQQMGEVVRDIC